SRNPFHAGHVFRGFLIHAFATACQVARPPCTDQTDALGPRGLLLPGFQRIGRPPRCWIWLQQRLDSSVGGTHPLNWNLAPLHQSRTCGFPPYGSCPRCRPAPAPVSPPPL